MAEVEQRAQPDPLLKLVGKAKPFRTSGGEAAGFIWFLILA